MYLWITGSLSLRHVILDVVVQLQSVTLSMTPMTDRKYIELRTLGCPLSHPLTLALLIASINKPSDIRMALCASEEATLSRVLPKHDVEFFGVVEHHFIILLRSERVI